MSDFGKQMTTYGVIVRYIREHGYSPTIEELAGLRKFTTKVISNHLNQLEDLGYIERVSGWRNIRLPKGTPVRTKPPTERELQALRYQVIQKAYTAAKRRAYEKKLAALQIVPKEGAA